MQAPASSSAPDSEFDLDTLLQESMRERKQALQHKEDRNALRNGLLSSTERAESEARIREWENKNEWTSKAQVILYNVWRCQCGSKSMAVFHCFAIRQQHKINRFSERFLPVKGADLPAQLPKESKEISHTTEFCQECAPNRWWKGGGMETTQAIQTASQDIDMALRAFDTSCLPPGSGDE